MPLCPRRPIQGGGQRTGQQANRSRYEIEKSGNRAQRLREADQLGTSTVSKSENLVALRVNFGDHVRTVLAGMKGERANPAEIEGKQALFVVNLPPRKMSEGCRKPCCLISATRMGSCLVLAVPEAHVPDGTRAG